MKTPVADNIKAHSFDRAYDGTDMYYGWDVRPEFHDFFNNIPLTGYRVLDLGAGEGRYAVYLARRGCTVTAVDFSASGINKLKAIAKRHRLPVVTELRDLAVYPFKEDTYDLVVAATILDHLEDSAREHAVRGILKALKSRGLLYANVFTTQDPGYRAVSDPAARNGVSDTSFGMAHYFTPDELKDCFADMTLLYYYEGLEEDLSHGRPHNHGWASLIAKKK
jgi:SAM-dependent methyltransferase